MHTYKIKTTQCYLWQVPRLGVACFITLLAFAGAGCVNDDTAVPSAERSIGQCELENNRLAKDYYENAKGQYAKTMTAGAALNIHSECSADSTYRWESPY